VLNLPGSVRIFVAREPTDMRKGFDGLAALVRRQNADVFSGHLFAFISKRRDRIKILVWDNGGFVLYYKRLEKSRFQLPHCARDAPCAQLDGAQLSMLLDGIDVSKVRRPTKWLPPILSTKGIDMDDRL
jgi:transposase